MIYEYNLQGVWDFSMAQMAEGICQTAYADTITLPGTTSMAKKGTPNSKRETGFLTDAYAFEGQAWFHKTVYINPEHVGNPMRLTLERTRLTRLWINGVLVGSQDSLCTPHQYDITKYVTKPLIDIVICVSNIGYPTKGGHLTSPDTQSNWNGITGAMIITVFDAVYVDQVQAYPDPDNKNVRLIMQLHGAKKADCSVIGCVDTQTAVTALPEIPRLEGTLLADETGKAELTVPLGDTLYFWDEYEHNQYYLTIRVNQSDVALVSFGLRTMKADGRRFTVNGKPVLLRGKHDGMIFPLTGAAPTDVESWIKVMETAKEYGINHYRFHTCCPPDAAFTAADMLGIYMEPELPFWGTITTEADENHNMEEQQYLIDLGYKIFETFGNHPSFVMFSLGNELWGSSERMAEILRGYHKADPRHLYTQGCNNFQFYPQILEEDDYFVGVRLSKDRLIRGSYAMCDAPLGHIQTNRPDAMHCYDNMIVPKTNFDGSGDQVKEIEIQYGTGVKKVQVDGSAEGLIPTKPVITHEIGQFAVYPNIHEIEKYTGPLKARNFEVFFERLSEKGMLHQAEDFFYCSGKLSASCYKEELEAVMRSEYVAGFQLLDLQDFSGQGTALVGMLDAFMESKGLIEPEEWRMFCNDAVILAKFPSYLYTAGDTFTAEWLMRNYRQGLPEDAVATWTILDEDGRELGTGRCSVPVGETGLIQLGSFAVTLPVVTAPKLFHVILSVLDTDICNIYDCNLYPKQDMPALTTTENYTITHDYTEACIALRQGRSVLFLPNTAAEVIPGFYCTDFWCYPMFRSISEWMKKPVPVGTMGLCIQNEHPALSLFPSEQYSTPQWYDIVTAADCVVLDKMPQKLTPVVQMIDNFERNHKLGILFEAIVGNGKLLVCSSRLETIAEHIEVRQFASSLLHYLQSEEFRPTCTLTEEQVIALFGK